MKSRTLVVDDPGVVYTVSELCRQTNLEMDYVKELISCGIIEPGFASHQNAPHQNGTNNIKSTKPKRFSQSALIRIHRARRLQRDLDLNLEGVALVMDLMDRNRELKARAEFLERLINRLHQ